jgi:hypothetical protein
MKDDDIVSNKSNNQTFQEGVEACLDAAFSVEVWRQQRRFVWAASAGC